MAKKLLEFQTAYKKLDTALEAATTALERGINNRANHLGAMNEGGAALKEHIAALKAKGAKGATADAFAQADKETLTLLTGLKKMFQSLVEDCNQFNAAYKNFTTAHAELKQMNVTLDAEVVTREKKKEGKIAMESKSLPDLKKLAAEVKKKLVDVNSDAGKFSNMDEAKEKAKLDKLIKDAA